MGKDQRAEHLQGCNSPRRIAIFVSPWVIFQGYLIVKPPGLFLGGVLTICNPTANVSPVFWVCTCVPSTPPVGSWIIGTGLDLGVVKNMKEELGKGRDEFAGLARSCSSWFPGPKGLEERTAKRPRHPPEEDRGIGDTQAEDGGD